MKPVFAGHVREGASDVVRRDLDASEATRFEDRSNDLSSSGCEGTIATTPVEILPIVATGSRHSMSSSC